MRSTRSPSSIKRFFGFAPGPAPPHAFGVTAEELVYAGFGRDGQRLALARYHSEPLASDAFPPGLLGAPPRDPEAFGERLEALLARIESPPREASLVVPDAWLRTVVTEADELPAGGAERDEVLRWKLKRQVPYRVEELRVRAAELPPLPDAAPGADAAAGRLLLGYGLESLFSQLEAAFAERGLRIGRLTNQGLAALDALAPDVAGRGGLVGLVLVHPRGDGDLAGENGDGGYTLVFALDGEPVLHRFKPVAAGAAAGSFVGRDLRLTGKLLADQLPQTPLARVLLAAPEAEVATWAVWLEEGLGTPVEVLGAPHLVPVSAAGAPSWRRLAPLLGAAAREVD